MDAGRLEQQVASVERGIAFLRQEHRAMLTGLQLEIMHLKRRCHGQSTGDPLLSISLLYVSPFKRDNNLTTCLIFFYCCWSCVQS